VKERLRTPWAIAIAVAVPLAGIYLLVQPPSGDLAAATYRSDLFARVGPTLWDNGWYGGHNLPGYSMLAPALGALVGNRLLLALCTVAAAGLFGLLAQQAFDDGATRLADSSGGGAARLASGSFALGACVGLLSGRVAYDLGFAIGLCALLVLQRGHIFAASVLAVLTSIASPVAGAFLALAGLAYGLAGLRGGIRRSGVLLAAAGLAPILALTLAFPEGGWEPFAPSVFWPGLAGVVLIALLLPRVSGRLAPGTSGPLAPGSGLLAPETSGPLTPEAVRALTWGMWLYALALIGSFALHTPVGSNAARLGELLGAPLVAGTLWDRHRLALALLAPVLLYWQLETPLNDVSSLAGDPSVNASYYAPLLGELQRRADGVPLRVEVPLTGAHWESVYLPEHGPILLARGWERQLDTRYGTLFYGSGLSPSAYRVWLTENAVAYVALPDVRLDFAGEAEGRLIARGLPYLEEVWRSKHWRLFAVRGSAPPAQRPAVLSGVGADSFTLMTPRAGTFTVRVRFTPYWALSQGAGCVREAPAGWTAVDARRAGTIRVGIDFSLARMFEHGPRCRE
jgi:hypothetical protein